MPVAWDDLLTAFEFVSFDGGGNSAYVCRETGAVYWRSEFGDEIDELPEDIDSDKYLALPDPRDLDLGKRLVMRSPTKFSATMRLRSPESSPAKAPMGGSRTISRASER